MKKCINLLILIVMSLSGNGQIRPIGEWKSHFSYRNIFNITRGGDKIFCSSENGIFSYENNQINILFKNDGLSDIGASSLFFDNASDLLIIGYKSGIIDLVSSRHITSINTLATAEIISEKAINQVFKYEDDYYLATDLGIAFLDMGLVEIRDVYRDIGPGGESVSGERVFIQNGKIFLWSDMGIHSSDISSNLFDFNNWELLVSADTILIRELEFHTSGLVFSSEELLYSINNSTVQFINTFSSPIISLDHTSGRTFITLSDTIYEYTDERLVFQKADDFSMVNNLIADQNTFWLATQGTGLVRSVSDGMENIIPNGPISDEIKRLEFTGSSVSATYSSVSEKIFSSNYDLFSGGRWANHRFDQAVMDVIEYQNDPYVATTDGLYNLAEEEFIEELSGDTITGLAVRNGWLWATSFGLNSLYLFDSQSWFGYPPSVSGTSRPENLSISEFNVAWIKRGSMENGGISVYEPVEDQYRLLTTADGLSSNSVKKISIANDDEVWVTAGGGLSAFFDASFVFDGQPAGELFFQGGPLLEGQTINATAFDGGDRKWIATNNGLWLFDRALNEQLAFYSKENSPLPSDRVLDLLFQPLTGELFILTDRGLVSLQTPSSQPQEEHSDVLIYPNPARLSDNQPIGIKGVVGNATIKVTAPDGTLVEEIFASGSTFSWDLRDFRGNRVNPGVYLFFSSSGNGEENFIGKIAVIP